MEMVEERSSSLLALERTNMDDTMAKARLRFTWAVLLATFANFGPGVDGLDSQGGTIHVLNHADYDISLLNKVQYGDGHTTIDSAYTPVPKLTVIGFQVMPDMDIVTTLFRMPTSAAIPKYQSLVVWSSVPGAMKIPCVPTCYWEVDNNGFSVASSEHGQMQFVTGWD